MAQKPKIIIPQNRKEWLSIKENAIGGSEITAALGLNEYFSPYELWLHKTKQKEFKEPNMWMRRGNLNEYVLATLWEEDSGNRILKNSVKDVLYVHPEYPFILCTPDRRFYHKNGGKRTLEIKSTYMRVDEPLKMWIIQIQWEMMLTGDKYGEILWEYLDPRIVYKSMEVEANYELQEKLLNFAIEWWETHIANMEEPPLINSTDVSLKFPEADEDKIIIGTDKIAEKYTVMVDLQQDIKQKTDTLESMKEEIKLFMLDASTVRYSEQTLFSWKNMKNGNRMFRIIKNA